MKVEIINNDNVIFLNAFSQRDVANILMALIKSFGDDSSAITIHINADELSIYTKKGKLSMEKDFAKQLIHSTIKGVLSPFKGLFWQQQMRITVVAGE